MNFRSFFPFFSHHPDLVYLDSAATSHKPQVVIDALNTFYEKDYATVHRAAYSPALIATDQYCETRTRLQEFIHAKQAEEIVFVAGTTEGINFIATGFAENYIEEGDEILVSKLEHHSNLVPWQMLAQRKKAKLTWIPLNAAGGLDLNVCETKMTSRTKIVAVTHVSNVTGAINPIREIAQMAHRKGAWIIVDGAQAAPHLQIDVQALDVDFYAFSAHKCYGPTGIGALYGKYEHLLQMKPLEGGGDMVRHVDWETSDYQLPPLRFEAGTPHIAGVIGWGTALKFLKEIDDASRMNWEKFLLEKATHELLKIDGMRILGTCEQKAPLLSFAIEGVHPLDLNVILDAKDIAIRSGHLCAQPLLRDLGVESVSRASFSMYNTEKEVDRFVQAVEEATFQLRKSCCRNDLA